MAVQRTVTYGLQIETAIDSLKSWGQQSMTEPVWHWARQLMALLVEFVKVILIFWFLDNTSVSKRKIQSGLMIIYTALWNMNFILVSQLSQLVSCANSITYNMYK